MLNYMLANTGVMAAAYTTATGPAAYAWLLIAMPLASGLLLLLLGKVSNKWGHLLGTLAPWASFALGVAILVQLIGLPATERSLQSNVWNFLPGTELQIPIGFLIDPLSITFVMLVTFVGGLIHIYSIAYMEHDAARRRFFSYLNIFVAAMLTLVLGNSYLVLFVGWEGVGLASYLLIGFWNHVHEYAVAAKKAFVMNRVGDLGLLLAMACMAAQIGTVQYEKVFANTFDPAWATAIGLFLLVGACGKSAQFPLQAWLGDAMAGPTPVSALIHAATMVTAGVYLMVRSGFVYIQTPTASLVVAIIGAITLMFGAIVGCAKDDMKKVLAASTMSQIGYMMLGAGLGPIGWAFAIFHLLTHGFFKAQLFLSAGSVMHAMSDQVNIRRFGGLSKVMKITWVSFAIGWWAILGLPPFSGFFSKDKIIEAAFIPNEHFGQWYPWVFGFVTLIGAGITAFYMSRLFFLIFHGEKRWTTEAEGAAVHPHESKFLMTMPLMVLSIFSIAMGAVLAWDDLFVKWLSPVTAAGMGHAGELEEAAGLLHHHEPVLPAMAIMGLTLAVVIVGLVAAWALFIKRPCPIAVPEAGALVSAARNDLYQDAVNEKVIVTPVEGLVKVVGTIDDKVVDGIVEGSGTASLALGKVVRRTQNGYVRSYAGATLGGSVLVLLLVLVTRF